jgi:hypothetical protein
VNAEGLAPHWTHPLWYDDCVLFSDAVAAAAVGHLKHSDFYPLIL